MNREDIQKLLGGYATGTLTPAEQQALFEAALEDQQLFDELAREQSLRDLLRDPAARAHLLATLDTPSIPWYRWFWRPLPVAGAVAVLAAAVIMVVHQFSPASQTMVAQLTPPPPPASPAISRPGSAAEPVVNAEPTPVPAPAQPAKTDSLEAKREERAAVKEKDAALRATDTKLADEAKPVSPAQRATAPSSAPAPPPPAPATVPATPQFSAGLGGGGRGGRGGGGGGSGGVLGGLAAGTNAPVVPLAGRPMGGIINNFAEIAGVVKDPTGAAVPGANVSARDLANGNTINTTTATDGQFQLAQVPPGKYEVQVASAGFRTASNQVSVNDRERAQVNATLNIGAATETVEVTSAAAAAAVQTENLQKKVADANGLLPLANRVAPAFMAPAQLQPPLQYTVLARDAKGTFADAGQSANVAAGTPIKLRIVPNQSGTLRILEDRPNGQRRQLSNQRVEQGKAVETGALVYRTTGTQQFQLILAPDAPAPVGSLMRKQQSQAGVPQSQSAAQQGQQQSQRQDAQTATGSLAAPAAPVVVTVTIR